MSAARASSRKIGLVEIEIRVLHILIEKLAHAGLRGRSLRWRSLRWPHSRSTLALAVALPPAPVAVIVIGR